MILRGEMLGTKARKIIWGKIVKDCGLLSKNVDIDFLENVKGELTSVGYLPYVR